MKITESSLRQEIKCERHFESLFQKANHKIHGLASLPA